MSMSSDTNTFGLDISKWQGHWRDPGAAVRAGVDFVYIRGGNGRTLDSAAAGYAAGCRSVGLPFGLYWYFRPAYDPIEQADMLHKRHVELGATLIPQLDIEQADGLSREAVTNAVSAFIDRIEHLFGRPALVYSAAWWWDPNILPGAIDMTNRIKWVARYVSMTKSPPVEVEGWPGWAQTFGKTPRLPRGWGSMWDAWQFSADGNHMASKYGFSSSHIDLNICKPDFLDRVRIGSGAPAPAPTPQPQPISKPVKLVVGARGEAVRELQVLLRAAGFYNSSIDGIFGPITDRAVRRYQQSRGLTVDGWAGSKTLAALRSNRPDISTQRPAVRETLRRGSRGSSVATLQSYLAAHGLYTARIDGIFGPATEAAVRAFQRQRGIIVDGIVGAQTWGKIL